MSTWVIGDIQGCFDQLQKLLDTIGPASDDEIIFCGDLINRGPKSLQTLRFIVQNKQQMRSILGNHDLHLLAIHHTERKANKKDTLDGILHANDCDELLHWLIHCPLIIEDSEQKSIISHAGIPHIWSFAEAKAYAEEVEAILHNGATCTAYFKAMYGNEPSAWHESLNGLERARTITNYLTRMRFITQDGELNLTDKGALKTGPHSFKPWFNFRPVSEHRILFGHWAALEGVTGRDDIIATDTGAVWGGKLSAYQLQSREFIRV